MANKKRKSAKQARLSVESPVSAPWSRVTVLLASTAFVSAFLLFQVQPLICKAILPWFGGAPAVWSTSMFFFQVVLLLGYLYAHWLSKFSSPRVQAIIHAVLVVLAVVLLPITPAEAWKPTGREANPSWLLLGLLTTSVGLPFFLLSTTAPLVQVWWHRLLGGVPYWLYAISNAGSLLALLTYPFLIEPNLGVRTQLVTWSTLFFGVAWLLATSSYLASRQPHADVSSDPITDEPRPGWRTVWGWIALSACGSVLLLAMTNHLTQNVAVVPFFWVLPLALYLISFIICFANTSYYRRAVFGVLMIVSHIACAPLYKSDNVSSVTIILVVHLLALFSGCMVCHGELARMAPSARYLTKYFVMISAGGALGGFLVSIVAPSLFPHYYEYPLVLVACWIVLIARVFPDKQSWLHGGRPRWAWGVLLLSFFLLLWYLRTGVIEVARGSAFSKRSFYGVLAVKPYQDSEGNAHMQLVHGVISHGSQMIGDKQREFEPTSYYRRDGGLGFVMGHVAGRSGKRVGMLGLGVGTVAAYCEPGDTYRAYEINPDVIEIATNPDAFTFWSLLERRNAKGDIVVGDARIQLERERRDGQLQEFDVLVVDVFSGDAIPVHLLTLQAFETYFKHLAADGILAVHISNRHLDLLSVVKSLADELGQTCVFVRDPHSEWVLVGEEKELLALANRHPRKARLLGRNRNPTIWTDDYSDILRVLY